MMAPDRSPDAIAGASPSVERFARPRLVLGAAILATAAACGLTACGDPTKGHDARSIFLSARCGSCHTLAAAGAHGANGPDLDHSERLDRAQIRTEILSGVNGMPSYRGRLSRAQLDAVTEFVYRSTR